jgi:MOSC domain-containing protein YiiM
MGVVVQIGISKGGMPKQAVPEADVTFGGILGDAWRHTKIHGGPRQAVLVVTAEGIDELVARGFPLYPGALGENVTARGLDRRALRVGQRYRVGEVVLELSRVREPCSALNVYGSGIQAAVYDIQVKAGDPASPRWGLSGFYASVVRTGTMRVGDSISPIRRRPFESSATRSGSVARSAF